MNNVVPDPVLTLRGDGLTIVNDDWRSSQEDEINSLGLAPADDHESVIVATLNPGPYTAVMTGKDAATGIGLVEVYDLGNDTIDATANAELFNLSTRGFVQTGDDVLIGGFIVRGISTKVIVRALGPSLSESDVPGALQNPTLELHDANGVLLSNDDWRSTQEREIIESQLAPPNERESAIIADLAPGNYTAIVRGKDDTTGVALMEVYHLK